MNIPQAAHAKINVDSMAKTERSNGLNLRDGAEKLTENGTGTSHGSNPELNGNVVPGETQVDKYGFTGGAQQVS